MTMIRYINPYIDSNTFYSSKKFLCSIEVKNAPSTGPQNLLHAQGMRTISPYSTISRMTLFCSFAEAQARMVRMAWLSCLFFRSLCLDLLWQPAVPTQGLLSFDLLYVNLFRIINQRFRHKFNQLFHERISFNQNDNELDI